MAGGPSYNRGRARAVRIKWISLAIPFVALVLLTIDLASGWSPDRAIRLALIAALAFGLVVHFAARLALAKWFSGSFTDDQDPMRF
jgi:hypothetical protein